MGDGDEGVSVAVADGDANDAAGRQVPDEVVPERCVDVVIAHARARAVPGRHDDDDAQGDAVPPGRAAWMYSSVRSRISQ